MLKITMGSLAALGRIQGRVVLQLRIGHFLPRGPGKAAYSDDTAVSN